MAAKITGYIQCLWPLSRPQALKDAFIAISQRCDTRCAGPVKAVKSAKDHFFGQSICNFDFNYYLCGPMAG